MPQKDRDGIFKLLRSQGIDSKESLIKNTVIASHRLRSRRWPTVDDQKGQNVEQLVTRAHFLTCSRKVRRCTVMYILCSQSGLCHDHEFNRCGKRVLKSDRYSRSTELQYHMLDHSTGRNVEDIQWSYGNVYAMLWLSNPHSLVTRVRENPEQDRDTTRIICGASAKAGQNPRLFDIFDKEFIERHGLLWVADWYTKMSLSAWGSWVQVCNS